MAKGYKTLYDREQEDLRREKYGTIHRGDIFYFDKSNITGVEQQGGRPGVVVSNNMCNDSSDFLLVCYLTTQPKTNLPTHVPVVCEQESICLCEQVHTLSKEKLQRFCCAATSEEMKEIDKALVLTLGIDLKNLLPTEYEDLLVQLEEKDNKIKVLEETILKKEEEIKRLGNGVCALQDELTVLEKSKRSIEDTPEYIRACAERDVYMKLYYELLERK